MKTNYVQIKHATVDCEVFILVHNTVFISILKTNSYVQIKHAIVDCEVFILIYNSFHFYFKNVTLLNICFCMLNLLQNY